MGVRHIVIVFFILSFLASAFVTPSHRNVCSPRAQTYSTLFSTKPRIKEPEPCEFELQELRIQLNAMKQNGIASRDLEPKTRNVLADYCRKIVLKRPSPVPLQNVGAQLPGTSWRLVLSTETATLGDLPRDAVLYLHFRDETNVDYTLQFSQKTWGLNAIKAKSQWTCDRNGLVTFVYDKITTDAFGFQDLGVGFFGLLKGRANFVETAYFDGKYWIERGMGLNGDDFLNVYVRD